MNSERVDVAVLGGGTAGAVVAGLLAERTMLSVALVEAGPDHGSFDQGRWPPELLDAVTLARTHDWGYDSGDALPGRTLLFERARVIGGCSAHNGCSQTVGHRSDYDEWHVPGSNAVVLAPQLRSAAERLRVRRDKDDELTPFQAAVLAAMVDVGIARTDDFDDLDGGIGCGPSPANNPGGIRWNSAFAYLDPVRDRGNLQVIDRAVVDRIEFSGSRAVRAHLVHDGDRLAVEGDRFVLCAGTYGSPAVLLRSGVGPPDELAAIGIQPRNPLPGVGKNLHDHPALELGYAASDRLVDKLTDFGRSHPIPDEQVIAKVRSQHGQGPFDLHLYPWTERRGDEWRCYLPAACLTPRSRGALRLPSPDPGAAPVLDHAYLSDPDQTDLAILRDGLQKCHELARTDVLAPLLGPPLDRFTANVDPDEASVRRAVAHYWHPVGTCSMGTLPDDGAVVDGFGRMYGCENLWITDASVIPAVPRATTNLTVVALAAHVVDGLV